MAKKNKPIRITSVEVQNFHRLTFARVEVSPDGGLIRVTGANAAGKTSLLDSIKAGLGGAGEVKPDSIHEDATTGSITLKLTNGYVVARTFTESNPKGYLTVRGPDGGEHKQRKLNEWLGDGSFDPLWLHDLKPDRLREVLLSISTNKNLSKELEAFRFAQQTIKDKRTPWISDERHYRGVKKPDGERPEPVDVSGEMETLQALQAREMEREKEKTRIDESAAAIESLRLDIEERQEWIVKTTERLGQMEEEHGNSVKELQEMPDVSDDIVAATERISAADTVLESLEPWKAWDKAQVDVQEASEQVKSLTNQINDVKGKEKALLQDAGIPIENLSFDEETGEPLLNEHPFSVASGRERADVAVDVAFAADPDLKVCLLDGAIAYDVESLKALHERAKEKGFQIFAVTFLEGGGSEIVVEDGVAKTQTEPEDN